MILIDRKQNPKRLHCLYSPRWQTQCVSDICNVPVIRLRSAVLEMF
ncbi:hypothetical protein P879_09951 [Paragonimus westermani]|uniref:Uncharacterized protein n=1 Tax=Paragonimus westermani TaxID=34504 RepID=A0A8T0DJD0_9TREM|nr:hypothetical protein P879_09951 [Paragonimus westermani]